MRRRRQPEVKIVDLSKSGESPATARTIEKTAKGFIWEEVGPARLGAGREVPAESDDG